MVVISQPRAIGDLLFIQPIVKHLNAKVAIFPQYEFINNYLEGDYIDHRKLRVDVNRSDRTKDFIPLRWANQLHRGHALDYHDDYENCMLDKYRYLGLPEDMWKELKVNFDYEKSFELFKKLNLWTKDYILVNNYSSVGNIDIQLDTDLQIVYMSEIKGYDLLNWHLVISNAIEFHTVSTSLVYMLEAMKKDHRMPKVFIYPRPDIDGLRGISQLEFSYECTRV